MSDMTIPIRSLAYLLTVAITNGFVPGFAPPMNWWQTETDISYAHWGRDIVHGTIALTPFTRSSLFLGSCPW